MSYYETYKVTPSGETDADGIDYKGSCEIMSFDTLEEAIEYADKNKCTLISEIGGAYDEYVKCWFCNEWVESTTTNSNGLCERCESYLISRGEL